MYSRKRPMEEVPEELTSVWICEKEDCIGWMRDNFTFETVPTCLQCSSPMIRGTKMLPLLVNHNHNQYQNRSK
ncbi:cold-shock protein [Paenibacillus thalictri]|uniref:Cold-shock protein n=1 Tax=Paenibacillus thalictri TaxID=2527873 RepID=A0A4Q9DR23_9BACL|nr:cold-shock protein [Paenibacillus thalictri]TBL76029.1 cold-shock protein [Paenibacillus thalictri]